MQEHPYIFEPTELEGDVAHSNGVPVFKDQSSFLKHFNKHSFSQIQITYLEGMFSDEYEVVDYLTEHAILILNSDTHVNIIYIRKMINQLISQ